MIILITGATSGFGYSMTVRLAGLGHTIIAAGRRTDRLESLPEEIASRVIPWTLDVRDRAAVAHAIEKMEIEVGAIDCLINNAGLALGIAPAFDASMDDWVQMVETNVLGVLYCTHAVLKGMAQRNFGRIVNIGSVAGVYPYPGGNVYGATKAFVRQFSLNLRADLVGRNVHVTDVEPGICGDTEFSLTRFHGDREKADAVYTGTKALGPEDIADVVSWLLSLPDHVNVNELSLMPICQAFGNFAVVRNA